MLARTFKDSKFVYYSDYDLQGVHIFSMLKYGCKATAWASDIQVCPLLEWGGPTRRQFFEHHQRQSDDGVWRQRREQIDDMFVRTINKTDRSIKKALDKFNLLDQEPILQLEVKSMFDGHGVSLSTPLALLTSMKLTSFPESSPGITLGWHPVWTRELGCQ